MLTDRNWTKTVITHKWALLYTIAFGYCLYPKDGIGGKSQNTKSDIVIDILLSHHQVTIK